jgi:hypothetical protein
VTRGTRLKKPSSSRGFARKARGAWGAWGSWGSWGLKTAARVRADASVLSLGNFLSDATVRPSHGRLSSHRPTVHPSVRYCPRDNPGVRADVTSVWADTKTKKQLFLFFLFFFLRRLCGQDQRLRERGKEKKNILILFFPVSVRTGPASARMGFFYKKILRPCGQGKQ